MSEGLATAPEGEGDEEKDGEERESEDPLLDLVMSDILGLGEEPVQSLEEVLRETEYLDTSGLNDYDSLSSLPGGGPASGLPSTPQVSCAYYCFKKSFGHILAFFNPDYCSSTVTCQTWRYQQEGLTRILGTPCPFSPGAAEVARATLRGKVVKGRLTPDRSLGAS